MNLSIFECRRYPTTVENPEYWLGALLIAATDTQEAKQLFQSVEHCDPVEMRELKEVYATGKPRIIYDDPTR